MEKCTAQYCTLAKAQERIVPHFRGDSGAWSDPDGYFGPAGLRIDTLPVLSSYSVPKPTMFVATGCLHGIRASGGLDAAGLGVGGIQFVQADILEWTPPSHKFDQVAAHFVLDCFRSEQLEGWWDAWRRWSCRRCDGCCRIFASRWRGWPNGGRGLFWRRCICFSAGPPGCLLTSLPRRTLYWCGAALSFDNGICSSGDFYTLICGF